MYSFGFERFLQLGGNFGIFAGNNLFAGMKNGDAAAETTEHLSKFQANVAAAKDEEMLGDRRELHEGFVGEIRDRIQAWDCRNVWAAAGVDENLFAFEKFIANLELMRADKPGLAMVEA